MPDVAACYEAMLHNQLMGVNFITAYSVSRLILSSQTKLQQINRAKQPWITQQGTKRLQSWQDFLQ